MISLKVKIIAVAIVLLFVIGSVVGVIYYIKYINTKITDLSVTIAEQKNEIASLRCQINSLEKNIDSLNETINITNDYISSIEKIRENEISTKQEIYNEVINDPLVKSWYDEEIPDALTTLLMRNSIDYGLCEDSN